MNKKGSLFFGLIIGIFIYVTGVLFLPFIIDDITTARVSIGCESYQNLTGGEMLTCLEFDLLAPYFIWFFLSMLLGFVIGGSQ